MGLSMLHGGDVPKLGIHVRFVLSRRKPGVDIYVMRLPGQPLYLCMTAE